MPGRLGDPNTGVLNGKIHINRTFFGGTPSRGYGKDSRVMCAPSYEYFREIQNYIEEMSKDYRGLFGAISLVMLAKS